MGLRLSYINFINFFIEKNYGININGLKMLELGDQIIKAKSGIAEGTGKDYFTRLGFDHTSVDINGNRGALVRDLTISSDFLEWPEYFDIITNSGTTEHVEPIEGQFECFKILHNCLKIGGIVIHLVPDIKELENGYFVNHCNYYYSENFFNELYKNSDYTILENKIMDNLRCVAVVKTGKNFWNDKITFLKNINYIPMREK